LVSIRNQEKLSGDNSIMSDKLHTDLGTSEIHKRHSVMVEGGKMPRAKVMDQTLIDRYLIDGILTLQEHQAGEYILSQSAQAGMYVRPLRFEASTGGKRAEDPMANDSLMRFGRTMKLISDRYGPYHKYLVEEVIIHGWDVSQDPKKLKALKEGLSWVAERRMAGGRNPVRHLRGK
jgi:hypothetical protein